MQTSTREALDESVRNVWGEPEVSAEELPARVAKIEGDFARAVTSWQQGRRNESLRIALEAGRAAEDLGGQGWEGEVKPGIAFPDWLAGRRPDPGPLMDVLRNRVQDPAVVKALDKRVVSSQHRGRYAYLFAYEAPDTEVRQHLPAWLQDDELPFVRQVCAGLYARRDQRELAEEATLEHFSSLRPDVCLALLERFRLDPDHHGEAWLNLLRDAARSDHERLRGAARVIAELESEEARGTRASLVPPR